MSHDYRLYPVVVDPVIEEQLRLEAMTSNQRRLYAIQKRVNGAATSPFSTQLMRIGSRIAARGSSNPLAAMKVFRG